MWKEEWKEMIGFVENKKLKCFEGEKLVFDWELENVKFNVEDVVLIVEEKEKKYEFVVERAEGLRCALYTNMLPSDVMEVMKRVLKNVYSL